MEFPERISEKATSIIARYLDDASEEKLAEINYGIAVIITNTYKMAFIFILAIILNIFNYFIAALLSFGALRTFAAGMHAKREWTCLPASTAFYMGIVYMGIYLSFNIHVTTVLFIICFAIVLKYAPADTEERPLVSSKLRKKLKLLSSITVIILYLFSLYYIGKPYSTIIILSVMVESILISPVIYKLTGNIYGVGINMNQEGGVGNEKIS